MNVPRFKTAGAGALSLLRSAWKGGRPSVEAPPRALDALQQAKLLSALQLGCPRSTAAKVVGMNGEQLETLLAHDEALLQEARRAEAAAEVRHMANINKASSDEKNWRTSVWWLEQRGLESAEAGAEQVDFPAALLSALELFAEVIVAEIPDVTRRQALLTKLLHISVESVAAPLVIEAETPAASESSPGDEASARLPATEEHSR
jgi:hypothetical protein